MRHEPPPKAFPLYGYFGIVITLLGVLGYVDKLLTQMRAATI